MGAQIFGKDQGGQSSTHDGNGMPPENPPESPPPGENDHGRDHDDVADGPGGYDPSESIGKAPGQEMGGTGGSYTVGEVAPAGFGDADLEGPQRHDLALVRI